MPIDLTTLAVLGVLFVATIVRSTFGFGKALVAMPLLAMLIGVKTAAPLVALLAFASGVIIVLESWRSIHFRSAWRLVLSSAAGIPVGLWCLKRLPEWQMHLALGVVVIVFAAHDLLRPRLVTLKGEKLAYLFGFAAGALGGAYNTSGPPVVIYGTLRRWPPREFRATLQGYFLPTGMLVAAGHGATGMWTGRIAWLFAIALPLVVVATLLGGWLNRRAPTEKFARWVNVLLLLIGAFLLAQSVRGHG